MNPTQNRSAVVLVLDRLGANLIGAYGSTSFETENFDRLAAQSLLFDLALTTSPRLSQAYYSLWEPEFLPSGSNLISHLGAMGVSSNLLTDEPMLEHLALTDSFDQVIPAQVANATSMARSMEDTELASFFAQATQWLGEIEPNQLSWLHSRGLSGAWDAPYPMRQQLADSEDPEPPRFHEPPAGRFDAATDDPDQLLGYQQACTAQVKLIDDFLGVILDLMDSDPSWQSTLFCLMSTRGYPLGEHGIVGNADALLDAAPAGSSTGGTAVKGLAGSTGLYNESAHIPLMIRVPNQPAFENMRTIRNGSLIQPPWVSECLCDWFADSPNPFERRLQTASQTLPDKRREVAFAIEADGQSIQTHAWKLIRNRDQVRLYAKPDDRWEVNDVSQRCPRIVSALLEILDDRMDNPDFSPGKLVLPEELAIRDN